MELLAGALSAWSVESAATAEADVEDEKFAACMQAKGWERD